MYSKEKRKSSGTFKPNLYFSLQVVALFLALSLVLQLTDVYALGAFSLLVSGLISLGVIVHLLSKRKRAIQRQGLYRQMK